IDLAGHPRQELVLLSARLEPSLPLDMVLRAALADLAPGRQHVVRDLERRPVPAERLPRCRDLLGPQRRAVGRCRALLVGRAIADDRLAPDETRTRVGDRLAQRLADLAGVEPV